MTSRVTTPNDIYVAASLCKDVHKNETGLVVNSLHCLSHGLPMRTFITDNDEILCVIGLSTVWDGVMQISAIFTTNVYEHRISLARHIKKFLDLYFNTSKIHRLEVTVKSDFEEGKQFMKFLGFSHEGTLRKYGSDKADYDIFGKVK